MSYNKDIDYQEKINESVKNKDYKSAAAYEKSRNEKIDGENLPYEKTNRFSGWLDPTDYSLKLESQMAAKAPKSQVAATLKNRINKASGTEGLSQYAYDSVYDEAIAYLLGGFSYEGKKPEFEDSYKNEIKELYNSLKKLTKFKYDPESDELYRYYKEQYNREGQRAMEDLLGEISANTGGVPSSYAVSAAGQVLENYNNKLTDMIPKLYESAYDKYVDSVGIGKDNLDLLLRLSDREYEKYLDELENYYDDRDFSYEEYLAGMENERRLEENIAEKEENARKWEQQRYENEQAENQKAIEQALDKWSELGYLDSESARILGLPAGLHTSDYDYKRAQEYKLYNR